MPETYILDTNGILRYVKIGPFTSVDEIKTDIEPYLPWIGGGMNPHSNSGPDGRVEWPTVGYLWAIGLGFLTYLVAEIFFL